MGGKAPLHEKICTDFAEVDGIEASRQTLRGWDRIVEKAVEKADTTEGKRRRASRKARKTELLRRTPARSSAYTYFTAAEQTAKLEEETSGSDTE